jgi:biopolymer transport protein ExbB
MPGLHGPAGVLLLLLSVAVLTIGIDRGRFWLLWWRRRSARDRRWQESLGQGDRQARRLLEDWDLEMRWGEPLLEAAGLLAPLLGLIGTVLGLIDLLGRLGPQLLLPAGSPLQAYGRVLISTALGLIVAFLASALLLSNRGLRQWQLARLERQCRQRLEP